MADSYILKVPATGSLDFGSSITLSGDFRIKIENISFLDSSADFNSVFGTGAASTNFLIYRRDGTNNQWQFRADGNTTNFTTGALPSRSIRGAFEFERVGATGYIRYRDSEITATVSSADFTLDTIGLINSALGANIQFGNIEIEESGIITHSYDFNNAIKTGVVISDSVGTNDLTGSGFTPDNWKQIFNYNPAQSAFTALPNGAQGQNPSGGWTCTGLDKLADGSWLIGNDGRSDPSDATQTPSIVNLSEDMTTIIAEYDMTSIVGAFTLQGVAVDADGTWWAASRTADLLVHLTSTGVLIDSWAITEINGIALDADRGGLWVVTVPNDSSGTNLRFWNFTTETFDSQYEINASGIDYQDHIHYRDDYLYLTHGSNGINGNVSVFDATEQVRVDLYTDLTDAQAIEGIYIDGANMYISNDGGFHTEADPAISALITYQLTSEQGNNLDIAFDVPVPIFSAIGTFTPPTYQSDIDFTVSAPEFTVSAEFIAPTITGEIDFDIARPEFSISASFKPAGNKSDIDIRIPAPEFSVEASFSFPGNNSTVSFTIPAPEWITPVTDIAVSDNAKITYVVNSSTVTYNVPANIIKLRF